MWAMSINYNLPLEGSQASNRAELAAGQGCAGRITRGLSAQLCSELGWGGRRA